MIRLRRIVSMVLFALLCLAAVPSVASAATASAGGTGKASPANVHPMYQFANECGASPGPGTWNTACIGVHGSAGTGYVDSIDVSLDSTTAPYFPTDICGMNFHVFGVMSNGFPYNVYSHPGCDRGEVGDSFVPHQWMKAPSELCVQTTWSGLSSSPICVGLPL